MPALRTLGLVILAALAVSIGILGFICIRAVFDESAARNAAITVADACGNVIASGGVRTVEVTIPGNYSMCFFDNDNQVLIDSFSVPEEGFELKFSENIQLEPGDYKLSITIQDNMLVITRI